MIEMHFLLLSLFDSVDEWKTAAHLLEVINQVNYSINGSQIDVCQLKTQASDVSVLNKGSFLSPPTLPIPAGFLAY